MDATCAIQASIHVFSLVRKYVSRILGTYQCSGDFAILLFIFLNEHSIPHVSSSPHFSCFVIYIPSIINDNTAISP